MNSNLTDKNSSLPSYVTLYWLIVGLIFIVGAGLRLYHLTDQPFDFHPTRQLRSAIIARGMYYSGLPNADPVLRDQAIKAYVTMEAYEPPILERVVALTYRLAGGEHLWFARVYSVLFWTIGGVALLAFLRRLFSRWAALFGLAFYMLLPWGVVASRTFQPDPWMVMWILLSAYTGLRWLESDGRSWLWAALAGLCCGLAILIKAVAAFAIGGLLLGAFISLLRGWKVFRRPQTYLLGALAVAIPAVYYFGLGQRSSDFASFWIVSFSGLLVTRKFYIQWLGLIHGIMDLTLFFGAMLGAFLVPRQGRGLAPTPTGRGLVVGLWLGYLLTGLAFPFQIYTHDYYSLMLVPLAALGLTPLAEALFERLTPQPRIWKVAFVVVCLGITSYYGWIGRSLIFAGANPGEQEAWQRMGQELPRDGDIIALTQDYGNRLKYYSGIIPNRLWPVQGDLDLDTARGTLKYDNFDVFFKSQTQGMRYFLVNMFSELDSQPDLKAMLYNHYPVVKQGNGYVLFDLTRGK